MPMACPDVEQLLDAFVDTELPPPQLLDVARHAATCATCDDAIRSLTALRQSVALLLERDGSDLDLSGVWPGVEAAIGTGRPRRGIVLGLPRAIRSAPVWGAAMALAASLVFWFSAPSQRAPSQMANQAANQAANQVANQAAKQMQASEPAGTQMASASGMGGARAARSANHAYIDRLAGRDVAVRREPKNGTTIIWVNDAEEVPR